MGERYYRWVHRFANALYFAQITVAHPERIPKPGPVLYLGLHRNGAVDGFIYHQVFGRAVFLVSTQLLRNWFSRLFFCGIAVTRTKDEGEREANRGALRDCVEHLRGGGTLFVFPEGTSALGPRHLPFKSGAAWLILDYLAAGGPPLQVVPVGIHYECPWAFRSKVEVVIGQAISLELAQSATPLARLKELRRRIQEALEVVGINVASEASQDTVQRLAYASTLATPRSYFRSLKSLEGEVPAPVREAMAGLDSEARGKKLLFHQGVPLFPMGSVWVYAVALLVLAPLVLGAIVLNLPPFLAAGSAGRKFADDRNVISLWRILVGVPLFLLWVAGVVLTGVVAGHYWWVGGYGLVTWLGLKLYYRVKKLAVSVHNGLRHPRLTPRALALRESLLRSLPEENTVPESGANESITVH